jgi:hypothetical protein
MPVVKIGKEEKFLVKLPEERKVIEEALEIYRDGRHDVRDFIFEFFGKRSSSPTAYIANVKLGEIAIPLQSYRRLEEYISQCCSK